MRSVEYSEIVEGVPYLIYFNVGYNNKEVIIARFNGEGLGREFFPLSFYFHKSFKIDVTADYDFNVKVIEFEKSMNCKEESEYFELTDIEYLLVLAEEI